jgi:hypothetical protein
MVVQSHDEADEIPNHQAHEESRRIAASDISFVYLGALGGERFRKLHHYRRRSSPVVGNLFREMPLSAC